MRRTERLLLLLLLSNGPILSQEENRLSVHFNPAPLIYQQDGPSYQVGLESKLYKGLSISFAYGGYINVGQNSWYFKERIKGFLLRPELKLYLNSGERPKVNYISLEAICKKQDYRYWILLHPNGGAQNTLEYSIHKEAVAINLKFGNLVYCADRFLFDWFVGGGINFVHLRDDLTDAQRAQADIGEGSGGLYSGYIRSDQALQPSITLGIRLHFRVL